MTEQELRERVALCFYHQDYDTDVYWDELKDAYLWQADEVSNIYKQANYVRLADDQSLPFAFGRTIEERRAMRVMRDEMLKERFRRVE